MKMTFILNHLKKKRNKDIVTGAMLFFNFFINHGFGSDKFFLTKNFCDMFQEKEKIIIVNYNSQKTYKIDGKVYGIVFEEQAYISPDTIKEERMIERKYRLSEENKQKMEKELKEIFARAMTEAFVRVFKTTFFDFEGKKIEYDNIKEELYQKIKNVSQSQNRNKEAKKIVQEVLDRIGLNQEEKKAYMISYERYLKNLVAFGTSSEIGLNSPWREYHNKKLAQEIADTVASFFGIEKTSIEVYLDEKKSNQQLSQELELFAHELLQSKNIEAQEYAKKVLEFANKIKESSSKEEILNFKKELREKIEQSPEIKKAMVVFHNYGVILGEINLKSNTIILPELNYYKDEKQEINIVFNGKTNSYEEKSGIITSNSELMNNLKYSFEKFGIKIVDIKEKNDQIKFALIAKLDSNDVEQIVTTNNKHHIQTPVFFIYPHKEKEQRVIYQINNITKYVKKEKEKEELEHKEKKNPKENILKEKENILKKESILILKGGWQIHPLIRKSQTQNGKIKIENLQPGSIKNLFHINSLGIELKLPAPYPELSLDFNPFFLDKLPTQILSMKNSTRRL
ncbi:MAG: hypothetical protein NC918_00355 [Candidatus Omnitrophica bacterium]|nr:hypothetical protein [Candidatus Omnitrophota bacterium]